MWENFQVFLSRPFSADMTALDWFLFLGMLIVIVIMWRVILQHFKELL